MRHLSSSAGSTNWRRCRSFSYCCVISESHYWLSSAGQRDFAQSKWRWGVERWPNSRKVVLIGSLISPALRRKKVLSMDDSTQAVTLVEGRGGAPTLLRHEATEMHLPHRICRLLLQWMMRKRPKTRVSIPHVDGIEQLERGQR